jgi:hypothetical protein
MSSALGIRAGVIAAELPHVGPTDHSARTRHPKAVKLPFAFDEAAEAREDAFASPMDNARDGLILPP